MSRWGYVPHKVDETSLAVLTLFAVNQQPDVAHFPVRRHPMDLSYDEFERLLLAVAYHIYVTSGAHKVRSVEYGNRKFPMQPIFTSKARVAHRRPKFHTEKVASDKILGTLNFVNFNRKKSLCS
jgi:hypothetical protein